MDVSASSPEAVLTYAVTDEDAQAVWCEVPSRLSHIPNCIWVSMDGQWPYLLVDPVPHRDRVVPNMECKGGPIRHVDRRSRCGHVDTGPSGVIGRASA